MFVLFGLCRQGIQNLQYTVHFALFTLCLPAMKLSGRSPETKSCTNSHVIQTDPWHTFLDMAWIWCFRKRSCLTIVYVIVHYYIRKPFIVIKICYVPPVCEERTSYSTVTDMYLMHCRHSTWSARYNVSSETYELEFIHPLQFKFLIGLTRFCLYHVRAMVICQKKYKQFRFLCLKFWA